MQLVHYSRSLVSEVTTPQTNKRASIGKPQGFWLSVDGNDDGWRDWCLGEEWGLDRLTLVHDVTLSDKADVLRIAGPGGIDAFTAEYREPSDRFYGEIDWRRVAERWQGIIIAPYVWSRRLHDNAGWYYSWDCASGCIWDAAAIASVSLREVVPAPKTETA